MKKNTFEKNTFLLVSVLLLSAVWAMAQNGPYRNDQGAASGRHVTVEGCLSQAGDDFTLTDQSGIVYRLTGSTEGLESHVGQTLRVRGLNIPGGSSVSQAPDSMSENAAPGAPAAEQAQTLSVTRFKRVSANCVQAPGGGSY